MSLRAFKLFSFILIISISCTSFASRHGGRYGYSSNQKLHDSEKSPAEDYITNFLVDELEVDDIKDYDLSLKTQDMTPQFSMESAAAIKHVYHSIIQSSYANAALLGMPGIGKTFLNNQLAFIFSQGIVPDIYKDALNIGNPYFEKQRHAFIGKTRVILVSRELLNKPMASDQSHAFNKAEDRQAAVLVRLCKAAEREFKVHGKRTIFVMDEVATLPEGIQNTIKTLTDKTGWHDPADPASKGLDVGYHFVVTTTPYEFRAMEKADDAIRRRYNIFNMLEISEESALNIITERANKLKSRYGGLEINIDALNYLIKMRSLLDLTPKAMPANVLNALEGLYPWAASQGETKDDHPITLQLAQKYINSVIGLSSIWLSGPNGEAPLAGLENEVKKTVKGQDEAVDKISKIIKNWARSGMDGPVPIIFLGGPSGSGKDTIFKAFNKVLFGHDGRNMIFGIGGAKDFAIDSLINGPPLGNHSDAALPTIIQRMADGNANSLLAFNESKDCTSEELDKLKVALERGYMQSLGLDPRPYRFRFPIFIIGQWGEEQFHGLSDEEISQQINKMDQKDVDNMFLNPASGNKGKVSRALLQRAKIYGGVIVLAPVEKNHYLEIVENEIAKYKSEQLAKNNIQIETTAGLSKFIVDYTLKLGEDTRGLGGTTRAFVWAPISESMEKGLPHTDVRVRVSVRMGKIVVQQLNNEGKSILNRAFNPAELSLAKTSQCTAPLKSLITKKLLK